MSDKTQPILFDTRASKTGIPLKNRIELAVLAFFIYINAVAIDRFAQLYALVNQLSFNQRATVLFYYTAIFCVMLATLGGFVGILIVRFTKFGYKKTAGGVFAGYIYFNAVRASIPGYHYN